jgi:hypothetical protein
MSVFKVCSNVITEYNNFCAAVAKADPKHHEVLLERLQGVKLQSLQRKGGNVYGKTTKGYTITITSKRARCTCRAHRYHKETCKHIVIVAGHTASFLYNQGEVA